MKEKKWTKLPDPDVLDKLLVRDFSQWEPDEEDDDETTAEKARDLRDALGFFDFYYDKMVPTVAGKKVWHPHARHHECMSTSMLPNKQLRVPPNTESLIAVMYRNCFNKWNKMNAWDVSLKGDYPMFKKPDINLEWATEYSDACGGQQKFGGWSVAGRVKFVKLAKIVQASRKKNAKRHLQVEQECVKRLQTKYEDLYVNKPTRLNKKRKAMVATREEEELLQGLFVDEEEDEEEEVQNAEEDGEDEEEDDYYDPE